MICDWRIRIVLQAFASYFCMGCFVLPEPVSMNQLLRSTDHIVLAEVVDVQTREFVSQNIVTQSSSYHFKILESIKGENKSRFTLNQYYKPKNSNRLVHGRMLYAYDFDGHADADVGR